MGLFRRQPPPPTEPATPPPPSLDLAQALEIVLVKSVESQATMAGKIGELVTSQLDSLASFSHRKLASKGGRKRNATAARNPNGTYKSGKKCRLCQNAATTNPTQAEIKEHMGHVEELPPVTKEEDIQIDKDGNEFIECEDCMKGVEHTHGQH